MSTPSSSEISLVSANIKLFNSKTESNLNTGKRNNLSQLTVNNNTSTNQLPTSPLKSNTFANHAQPTKLIPPPLPTSSPPPLPTNPPRSLIKSTIYNHNINVKLSDTKTSTPPTSVSSTPSNSTSLPLTPSPIIAQKSGSTLKVMLGKVVGSVSEFWGSTKQLFYFVCI